VSVTLGMVHIIAGVCLCCLVKWDEDRIDLIVKTRYHGGCFGIYTCVFSLVTILVYFGVHVVFFVSCIGKLITARAGISKETVEIFKKNDNVLLGQSSCSAVHYEADDSINKQYFPLCYGLKCL
jgi:hypothetical protein